MNTFECQIARNTKKVSYPNPVVIDFLFKNSSCPIPAYTNEIRAGELIIINVNEYDKIKAVFRCVQDKIIQIYGDAVNPTKISLECIGLSKKKEIEKYIISIFNQLSINELIVFKNDLECLENALMGYLLICKNQDKLDSRKLRTICFKNCKDVNLCEKLYRLLTKNKFEYFEVSSTKVKIDLLNSTIV